MKLSELLGRLDPGRAERVIEAALRATETGTPQQINLAVGGVTRVEPEPSSRVVVVVHGTPAPQGSKSFKGMIRGKDGREHAVMAESSKKVKPWRKCVKAAAEMARAGRAPLDGPLIARMIFTMPKPKSAPKGRRTWPAVMPDLSKLVRSTEDALVDAGLIADDARIVEYERIAKVYAGEDLFALESPGAYIEISPLT